MENFFNYITKPLKPEEVEILFDANNIIREKIELYSDFTHTLNILIVETYMGEIDGPKETKINLTDEDNEKHFEWCWDKTISIFKSENIEFEERGEHFDYFQEFFEEIFYIQDDKISRKSVDKFFNEIFQSEGVFTQSDLDTFITIYKLLDKSIKY